MRHNYLPPAPRRPRKGACSTYPSLNGEIRSGSIIRAIANSGKISLGSYDNIKLNATPPARSDPKTSVARIPSSSDDWKLFSEIEMLSANLSERRHDPFKIIILTATYMLLRGFDQQAASPDLRFP